MVIKTVWHWWQGGVDLQHVDVAGVRPKAFDCAVIVTDHKALDHDALQRAATVVVDTRNAIKTPGPHVVRLGAPRRADVLATQTV